MLWTRGRTQGERGAMKPLLVVVDDDPAVLQALETELRQSFEGSCAVESFDRPADVLETLPRWREQGRRIAVAVVDQKMPEITGTELIRRLRARGHAATEQHDVTPGPTAGTRTMILTGYGGPEIMAEAAGCGVDLYREKPWYGPQLKQDVARLIESYRAMAASLGITDVSLQDPIPADREAAPDRSRLIPAGVEVELPSAEVMLACAYGYASPSQRRELEASLVVSSECRRIFSALLEDVRKLER